MKKKPAVTLLRGNTPKEIIDCEGASCWRCGKTIAKNDKLFEVPGPTRRNDRGGYYKDKGKSYCQKCMQDNILRTEQELDELKKKVA